MDYKPNKKIPLYVNSFMISHIMESDSLAGKSFQTWLWLATLVQLARANIWYFSYESLENTLENQLAREFKLPSRDFLRDLFSYFTPSIVECECSSRE